MHVIDLLGEERAAANSHAATATESLEGGGAVRTPHSQHFSLGVLLVHGIGTQPQRHTLVSWGDQLLNTIRRATKSGVTTRVERATPGDGSSERPAEATVQLSAGKTTEWWLLTEAWWAQAFPSPTYGEIVSWSLKATPWAIALHIAQRYWQTASDEWGRKKLLALAKAALQLVVTLALAPLAITILALTLLLGLLPIAQLRSVILSIQSALTGTIGDSLAFVESPMRAGLIRTRILEQLERLIATCRKTIIIAHSQGAAAVLDALGGMYEPGETQDEGDHQRRRAGGPVPDTLVTFGAGINQLASLKVLSRGLPKNMAVNPAFLGVASLLAAIGLFGWLAAAVRAQRTTIASILMALLVLAVSFALMSLILWGASKLIRNFKGGSTQWPIVVVLAAVIGGGIYYANRANLPLGTVNMLFLAVMMFATSLGLILSTDMKSAVTEHVREPAGLARWIDIYASADPVPNGPTRIKKAAVLEPVPVWNQGSILSDHTTYWRNLDGFLLRVTRACADTAGSAWRDLLSPEQPIADRRAEWRVKFLRSAGWITGLAWSLVLGVMLTRHGRTLVLPFGLPDWTPLWVVTTARWLYIALLVGLAAWIGWRLVMLPWSTWVRSEQVSILAGGMPTGTPWLPLFGMGIVVAAVLYVAVALAGGGSLATMFNAILEDPAGIVASLIGSGGMLALFARFLRPPK